jgi:hypothetical protein
MCAGSKRRVVTAGLGLALAVLLNSCAFSNLPTGARLEDGPAVRDGLEKATGIRLRDVPQIAIPGGSSAQPFIYAGSDATANLFAFVFDRPRDLRHITGGVLRSDPPTQVIAVKNALVLYTPRSTRARPSSVIRAALRRAL